ncbi:DUF6314 family protein [Patulibacter sp. SYSU D01012]|uniref:DUF6314 family protein n=1 Tax=Patulibacter sp. SYSU D01012 TaxID=2817381 RepID=UPI001B30132B|nr:DUF6314 family protein [Patulibacter sp. SYSU D01012]
MPAPSLVPVRDPRAFLAGTWAIDRDIHDHRSGQDGTLEGVATLTPDGDGGLVWAERGTMRLGGFVGAGTRTTLVRPEADGWVVRFDDGRYFHPLDLATGACRVDHPCGEDHYAGEIRAEGEGRLVVAWRVVGPAKDHTIVSRYTR